ncbi:hypothetical protein R1sor_009789 [Riccia sorocarpa]|uniref:Uncharacterized protein n=1 Tax=Riccia sorocarpa TaxID=122646 RepID=A0ABD3HW89_9MARC
MQIVHPVERSEAYGNWRPARQLGFHFFPVRRHGDGDLLALETEEWRDRGFLFGPSSIGVPPPHPELHDVMLACHADECGSSVLDYCVVRMVFAREDEANASQLPAGTENLLEDIADVTDQTSAEQAGKEVQVQWIRQNGTALRIRTIDEDRNLGTRQDHLKLFVETESEFDAKNYIDWRHCVQANMDHCVSCITQDELALVGLDRTLRGIGRFQMFVQSYDANAHTFNFRNREETLSLELIREALSLPERVDTVPDFVKHKSFASWFPHYNDVGKKIFAHTCVKKKWIPIIQVINICLLARPRPHELHGKLAFTLISKVDREPALDFDWAKLILADVEREIKSLQGQIAKEGKRKPK